MKLKIFTDRAYLPEGKKHIAMLYPFWGKNPEDPADPNSGRYDRYVGMGSSVFEMTTLEKADIAVFPGAWEDVSGNRAAVERAERFLDLAHRAHKPTVIFFWSDSDEAVPYENIVVFRTSCYRSRQRRNEFAMPAWSEDFVAKYLGGQLPVRPKTPRAVVGFCGYAPPSIRAPFALHQRLRCVLSHGKRFVRHWGRPPKAKPSCRTLALQALAASPKIDTKFVIRDHFLGGGLLPAARADGTWLHVIRQEYVRNMIESGYVLCARGGGNFSYRLYETLSCGRIPVFVDTDCVLPYQSEINWKDYCAWVDEKEVGRAGDILAAFHDSATSPRFMDLQRECRKLWEDYLSPEGFFTNLHKHLR